MDNFERIERYKNEEMSKEEMEVFENDLIQNKKLQSDFAEYEHLIKNIQVLHFKENASKIVLDKQRSKSLFKYLSAASILLLGILCYYFISGNVQNNEEIFYQYFEPYPSLNTIRGSSGSTIDLAFEEYKKGGFRKALQKFDQDTGDPSPKITFYKAQCYLVLGEYQTASELLNKIKENSIYYNEAQWYLGLSLIKQNRVIEAEMIFEKLLDENPEYKKVQRILNDIN